MTKDERLSLEPLRQFHKTTDLIPRMVSAIQLQQKLLHTHAQEVPDLELLASYLSDDERTDVNYLALIIMLYGAVERFAEDLTKELAKCTAALAHNAGEISENLKDEHLLRSIKYIDYLRSKKSETIEPLNTVLSRLSRCMNNESFELNTEAYGLHTANIRQDSLTIMFRPLGLGDAVTKAIGSNAFQNALVEKGRTETTTTFHLDDLADRRNAVAHGRQIDDRLNIKYFIEYAEILSVYADSLVDAALALLAERSEFKSAKSLGLPTQKYKSGKVVVCCPTEDVQIRRGYRAMWRTSEGSARIARIMNLQVDSSDAQDGIFTAGCEVGLLLDCKYTGQIAPSRGNPLLIVTH